MTSLARSIGLIASLKRAEEGTVPSFPEEFTLTGEAVPVIGACQMPAT